MAETATIASDSTGSEGFWRNTSDSTGVDRPSIRGVGVFRNATASFLVATMASVPTTTVMSEVFNDRILNVNQSTTALPSFESLHTVEPVALTPGYALALLRSAFGLNMSETARVLHVERPTVYSWLRGAVRPRHANLDRLLNLHALAAHYSHLAEPVAELVGTRRSDLLQLLEGADPGRDSIDRLLSDGARIARQMSVREWADQQGIPLGTLHNPEADVPEHSFSLDVDE